MSFGLSKGSKGLTVALYVCEKVEKTFRFIYDLFHISNTVSAFTAFKRDAKWYNLSTEGILKGYLFLV